MKVYHISFGGKQVESSLEDAINAKLTENVESGNVDTQLENMRNYMRNLTIKLVEKGVLAAWDLEDGLMGHRFNAQDE